MWKFADGPLNRQDRYLRRLRLDHLRISYNEHLCRFNVSRSEGSTIFAFSLSSELLGACIRFMKQWRCIQARFLVNAARIHPSSPEQMDV